ncbi:MAG TPA: hypothetical protein VMD05_04800, partial [Candidatus Nanoarchaeia archaeon]|nr:hypothetical protein [Candidatus Nanoarchaeia archaeon]
MIPEEQQTVPTIGVLPFIYEIRDEKQGFSFPAELACIVYIAETQRKKATFLREKPEKIVFISKTSYPLWLVQTGKKCVLTDGLTGSEYIFKFSKPTKTPTFIEELMKNSPDPEKFVESLENQAESAKDFSSNVNVVFSSLVTNRELLNFFQESLKIAKQEAMQEATIPSDFDSNSAAQTAQVFTSCMRTVMADARGLQVAIAFLKGEAEFHEKAAHNEIEQFTKKCDAEISVLKPIVDKNVKKISQKADRTLSMLRKTAEKKVALLEKRREIFLHKLQLAEQRVESIQHRIEAGKSKKKHSRSSFGSFAKNKYEQDVEKIKKEVRTITEETENLKKIATARIKQRQEEFDAAISQEEFKLIQIQNAYQAKIE